ncbi:MAG TPA: long-chain fatty acid--CoA ligase [Rubrobacteraceae bacterium]|nr:long-chain fatty acid--CoA ligase [Rubrobacteraceae bacterium]
MFRTEKPWLEVYGGRVEPETEFFEGPLYDLFRNCVEEHRGKTALTFYGTEFPFERLHALVEKMAASLAAAGVKKGDRVALMLPNCPQYVISFFATVRLGAVVTQINPMYVEREIEQILQDSGAASIVAYEDVYPRVKAVLPKADVKNVIVVSFGGEPQNLDAGHRSFSEFLSTDADPALRVELDAAEDMAALQYTGGTTGVSKGAMLTHRNLAANVQQAIDVFVDDPAAFANNQKVIAVLPFFHIYGFTCVMLFGVVLGLNQLLLPRFDVAEVLDHFEKELPTMFSGVPTMYMALVGSGADLRKRHLHEVRTYTSGGAALPVNLKRTFEEKVGRPLFEGYGLSEASPVTHFNPPFVGRGREGSIGIPIPSTDARIADVATGENEVPLGESGELVVKGPQVMKGYWGMPEETAEALRGGWLYTGDIARMDGEGYFYIVDRKKDMILVSGYNVYPREIEEVLFEHPDVVEAVAVGVPDEYRGETVKAFVVKREGASVTEEELVAFCAERLAPYRVPKAVEFRNTLPKSTVGKLLRRVLADEERERAGVGTQSATGTAPPPSPS